MQVVITGGAGMLGKKLAKKLLERGTLAGPDGTQRTIDKLVLMDIAEAPDIPKDKRVSFVAGQVYDPELMRKLISGDTNSVFHFAAVVSAGAEADFDLGYKVNLDGTRVVLEACRALKTPPRVVFTSSVAVYGGDLPPVITDEQKLTPQTSYGAQKAMGELLVADYTRKGFIDGRALRLPTIVVRPGKPNKAASGFASSIIREPLMGRDYVCPVPPETRMWVLSPRRVIEALIHAHEIPAERWGMNRVLNPPGRTVSMSEALDAVRRLGGAAAAARVSFEPDPFIMNIVAGWPTAFDTPRAHALGFQADESIDAIVQAFIEDERPAALVC